MSDSVSDKTKVLIVALNSRDEADLRMRLERLGYSVAVASVPLEHALRQATTDPPDLVLLGGGGPTDCVAQQVRDRLDRPVILLASGSADDDLPDDDLPAADLPAADRPNDAEPFPLLVLPCTNRELHFNVQTAVLRHKAEQALTRQRADLHATLSCLADAVVVTDAAGRVRSINVAGERLTGWPEVEAAGRFASGILNLLDPVTRLPLTPIEDALGGRAPVGTRQLILVARNGRERTIEDSTALLSAKSAATAVPQGDSLTGCVFAFRDITEKLRAERESQQVWRMESLGRLAAGLANDFNNLLTVIVGAGTGGIEALSSSPAASKDAAVECFSQILTAADSGAQLARKLLSLGGRQTLTRTLFALNDLVLELAPAMRATLCDEVGLEIQAGAWNSTILADRQQIEQVILNLFLNARDAIAGEGKITLATGSGASPGEVRLTVTDTGVGIPVELHSRIFEPFFTTRQPALGTGLGLTGIYGIVTQSGGRVDLTSAVGAGSAFVVTFQLADTTTAAALIPGTDAVAATNSVVLLVEDDPAVRQLQTMVLESAGLKVRAAASGETALCLFQTAPDDIGLLVTDVLMPGMSGLDLARQLQALRPALPVLFVSGFSGEFMKMEGFPPGQAGFLEKPFHPQSFKDAVLRMLVARDL